MFMSYQLLQISLGKTSFQDERSDQEELLQLLQTRTWNPRQRASEHRCYSENQIK